MDQIEQINSQLASLKRESIDAIKNEKVITIDEMNQIFTGEQLAEICSELSDNLLLAPKIVSFAEKLLENLPQSASD
ncbi:hypothetical protein KMS41_23400 [Ochrobactrum sp. BTU1]|nr:hypothetical protein KMS41_23400 [Ochrobactrum sp. BTU1]